MQNFRLIVHIVYLFLCGCGLHYNGLSVGNDKIHNYPLLGKKTNSSSLVLRLVSFASSQCMSDNIRTERVDKEMIIQYTF